jgi:FdhD protein
MNNRGIPDEYPITLTVNGFEIAIFQLTNLDLEDWACGYLYSEGYIQSIDDITSIAIYEMGTRIS